MRRGRFQAGEGKIGCIFWTLVIVVLAVVGWKMIPIKIATSELYDYMVEQAKWAASMPPEQLQKGILAEARRLNLPVEAQDVKVVVDSGRIKMSARFTVPVDFPVRTYNWDFNLEVDRPVFSF